MNKQPKLTGLPGLDLQALFREKSTAELGQLCKDLADYARECEQQIPELENKLEELRMLRGQVWREHGYAATELTKRTPT